MKYLEGTLFSSGTQYVGKVHHNLNSANILAVVPIVEHYANQFIGASHTAAPGFLFDWFVDPTYFQIKIPPPVDNNIAAINGRPFRVIVFYRA